MGTPELRKVTLAASVAVAVLLWTAHGWADSTSGPGLTTLKAILAGRPGPRTLASVSFLAKHNRQRAGYCAPLRALPIHERETIQQMRGRSGRMSRNRLTTEISDELTTWLEDARDFVDIADFFLLPTTRIGSSKCGNQVD